MAATLDGCHACLACRLPACLLPAMRGGARGGHPQWPPPTFGGAWRPRSCVLVTHPARPPLQAHFWGFHLAQGGLALKLTLILTMNPNLILSLQLTGFG